MKKIADSWFKFLANIVEVLFLAIVILCLFYCTLYQQDNPQYKMTGILSFASIILLYFCCFKIFNKIENKRPILFKIVFFITSILIYGIWNIYARTQPISDYEVLIKGAKEMANGTFANLSFDKSNYFYYFNFQTGFVTYLALIMKVLGQRLVFLKLVEILVMALTNLLVYEIGSKIYSKKVGLIASISYSLLLFNIIGSSIVNNQHIAMLFIALAIYIYIYQYADIQENYCSACLADYVLE